MYVEDFTILQMADGDKVVQFEEKPTKTRQGGLRNKTQSSPQQMWCTDGGERDHVKLFEILNGGASHQSNNEIRRKFLARRLHEENY